jgi:hypothetical protein
MVISYRCASPRPTLSKIVKVIEKIVKIENGGKKCGATPVFRVGKVIIMIIGRLLVCCTYRLIICFTRRWEVLRRPA